MFLEHYATDYQFVAAFSVFSPVPSISWDTIGDFLAQKAQSSMNSRAISLL